MITGIICLFIGVVMGFFCCSLVGMDEEDENDN